MDYWTEGPLDQKILRNLDSLKDDRRTIGQKDHLRLARSEKR